MAERKNQNQNRRKQKQNRGKKNIGTPSHVNNAARRKRKRIRKVRAIRFLLVMAVLVTVGVLIKFRSGSSAAYKKVNVNAEEPTIDVQLLDVNPYSRPGTTIDKVNGVVVHYTANPGSTAQENRDYFNGLKDSHETEASSNFVIGLEGEIIQCVPTWEMAYASNNRNADTVSIECCHPDETGKFTDATYKSLVQLTAWLCAKYDLAEEDVIRHYDVTGKICPKYFVDHEDAWNKFKENVGDALLFTA